MIRKLATCFAALALTLVVSTAAQATVEIFMPTVTANPGDTSVTAILWVRNSGDEIRSVNPALEISTMMGPGTGATIDGPNGAGVKTSTQETALGPLGAGMGLWGADGTDGSAGVLIDSTTLRKFSLDNGQFTVPAFVGDRQLMQVEFGLGAGAVAGTTYQVNLTAEFDVPPNGQDSTWVGTDTSNNNPLTGLGGLVPAFGKIVVVPEPSSFALLGLVGCVGIVGRRVRNRWFSKAE